MIRKLTVTRKNSLKGGVGKWAVKLDGFVIAKLDNGQTQSFQIDERSHNMEIVMLSVFGTPTHGIDPATALIMAGTDDCTATVSLAVGLVKNKIKVECQYDAAPLSEADFIDSVTEFMVRIFGGDAILERIEDPNNRNKDLRVVCLEDGVHIRWDVNEVTMGKNWSTGYEEEIVPYEVTGVHMPKDQLTSDLLTRLEDSVKNAILARTRFTKNKSGAFVLGNQKSSLY